jgi:hypothetical protein
MHPNTAAALAAGRERWLRRMRLAKQLGLITRFPNGRRPRGAPKLHSDKLIRKAQRIIERRVEEQAEMAKLHMVPGEESAAELHLETVTGNGDPGLNQGELPVNSAAVEDTGDNAEELLQDILVACFEVPGRSPGNRYLWDDLADGMDPELFERLDAWLVKIIEA